MGKLEEALVERVLETSAEYKRAVMENTIRSLLGAAPLEQVTGLPPRRGPADGGIDGIIYISNSDGVGQPVRTAINVKVRKTDFTREQLGGFLLDMDRERITSGVIITAASLAPDAEVELERKNREGTVMLYHIRLADILAGDLSHLDIFIGQNHISSVLTSQLREILSRE
ncbi:restriction endonuclease [Massilia sp. CT11-108]|uniref:restriction endonuclease n=1 Tax=Massilia sp. CT11-108 TaxID=3393900 RepID=UPI0039A5A1A6